MSRIRITLFFILVLGTRLFATDLTLEQALQSAKATNITAQNAKITLEKQLNQANSNQYLPSINISAGSSASVSLLEQNSSAQISPTASISFSLSSTDRYTKASNSLLAKTAQTTYNSSILNLEMQVLQAYWSVAAAQLAYEQQQAATEQTRASYESIQAHYEQGLTNSLAVSQAKLAYSQSSLTLGSRKTDYETAKQELQNLVGYEFEETADELWDTQSLKPLADLQDLALGTSSIQLLAYQIEQAELALKKTRASSASPIVAFNASTSLSSTLSTTAGASLRDTTQVGVTVSLSLDPYLPNSTAQVTLENLQQDVIIAQNELQQGIRTVKSEVQARYQNLLQIEAELDYLTEYQRVAEATHALTQASYEAGEVAYLTLAESEQQALNARLSILQQRINYTVSLYELAYLLETDINTIINI
ncbi:MAG TPA: hypothetical protein DD633_02345 [Sphaerochaeta sp.]|nr:hypothetical protein [Sphaerochaeta sp.]HBO35413.1 hypothetical protein [Sphaerochaeta sp.]